MQPNQPNQPKRVRFAEVASLRMYPKLSKKSLQHAWYTKQEMDSFKIAIRDEILSCRKRNAEKEIESFLHFIISPGEKLPRSTIESFHENALTMRGIEHIVSSQVLNLIVTKRKMVISHVLREQETQKLFGISDDRRLAEASMRCTKFSKMWSSQIACARAA
mmetsp:Transcript_24327/g.50467  ORF Transcript_24327/g.50467 Transcript_24327/m.50467 type:complete len:162 (+) Transcript_24327:122-607(+)